MDTDRWQRLKAIFDEALAYPPREREAFLTYRCDGDEALRAEVASLLASLDDDPDFLEDPVRNEALRVVAEEQDEDRSGTRLGPYRLVRPIGHGGMGEVYLAERADGQFEQRVAIKLVRHGGLRADLRHRLRHERQILASLQHPNIARLLDGGMTRATGQPGGGQPYLVMEYVEGVPIDQYCDQHRFSTAQRLQLFRTVCAAVQYAHQNLIVHRDLKPSNILVTEAGTVKLLDFGIAKLLGEDATGTAPATRTGVRAMTPEYASPEQVRGLTITTASDVYALGVVLYELLTGHRPYEVHGLSAVEVERIVCETEPPRPSTAIGQTTEAPAPTMTPITPETISQARRTQPERLHRRLRGDLDNMIMKALRKEPSRRYSSVEQFSEDVRRHLAQLPVIARPATVEYRVAKFVRRHTAGVAATVLVLCSLLGGIIATTHQARVAEAEREKAEARFADVRALANTFLFDFHDAIRDLPGATPARRLLVANALTYLDLLANEGGADPSLQAELAEAYLRVGEIQGDPHFPNLGDMSEATAHYRQAVALREARATEAPDDADARHALALAYGRLAVVRSWGSDNEAAIGLSEQAVALLEPLAAAAPTDRRLAQDLGRIRSELGWWRVWAGQMDEAMRHLRRAEAELLPLAAAHPDDLDLQIDAWRVFNYQVDGLWFAGHSDSALAVLQLRARPLVERLDAQYPYHPRIRGMMKTFHSKLGGQLDILGRYAEALDHGRHALADAETLIALDATDQRGYHGLAMAHESIGTLLEKMNRREEAAAHLLEALALKQRLYDADPNGSAGNHLGITQRALCDFYLNADQPEAALPHCEASVAALESAVRTNPEDAVWASNLGRSYISTARVHGMAAGRTPSADQRRRHTGEAVAWYDKGIATMEALKTRGVGWEIRTDSLVLARAALAAGL